MRQSDAVAALAGGERSKGPAGRVVRSEGSAVRAESGRRVADPELESLRAAVFGMTAEGVATSEAIPAEGALVVARFEVHLQGRVSYVFPRDGRRENGGTKHTLS